MIDPGLDKKVALVTGANSPMGIGASIARALAAQGVSVFLSSYRRPARVSASAMAEARAADVGGPGLYEALGQEPPEAVARDIEDRGGRAACGEADLAAPATIPPLFDLCEQQFGPVDILINNHAHWQPETFDPAAVTTDGFGMRLADAASIDAHHAVNARGTALMMAEFVRRHLRRGATWGRIINISTDAADAHVGAVSYAASKHALESYSRSAAAELGKYGITVNVVAPGPIQTGWLRPDDEVEIGKKTPLGRVGRPEDIAGVVVFLASMQARWLTGQLLYAGGGWKMPL
jgi:3-oxoacyl-[acyl-carrier protein] reductase